MLGKGAPTLKSFAFAHLLITRLLCSLLLLLIRAVNSSRLDSLGVYMCPVYKTEQRGPTYVFSSQLKTKSPPARWILAGVALLLDVV